MKLIIKILKSKRLLVVIGFILLICLILAVGAWLGLALNTRLIIILIILATGIIILLFKQMQANKGAALIEQSIKAQAEEQKLAIRPDKREEIEELKHELASAIESLKKSKLGKGRSGRAALYALPWYMFIGPPAAGKTTAIINSGLEFPFGFDIKGVGGTRNCDWFFSNSAILLDTAGRYMTEEEDKEEYYAFLDILKKYRRLSPINGVLVGISITDIINATTEDIEWHAKNIRRRIDELILRLGIRFPVYLVFTKCDLLQGFVELFENLSRKEREQIWGCTLSSEQNKTLDPREIFDKEFQVLIQSLNDFRLKRLSSPTKPENRSKVYVFPLEFASIMENVGHFIGKLFQPNPYKETPQFRGFYFTSGTQEGTPIDRVIQAIAKQFDLPPEATSEPVIEKKSYFIKNLFTDVIIPDQKMVTPTSKTSVFRNRMRTGAIAASLIILGAFILGISLAYIRSRNNLAAVKGATELMNNVQWDTKATLASDFKYMDRFREQLVELVNKKNNPPLIRSGLYRGNAVLPHALKLYYRKLSSFVNVHLYRELERRMKYQAQYYMNHIEDYLRAYLLMDLEVEKLDVSNENFLIEELISILDESDFPFIQDDAGEVRPIIERQVEFFVKNLGKEGIPTFENDKNLISSVRNLILKDKKPSFRRIYNVFKNQAEYQLSQLQVPSFTLLLAIEEGYKDIFFSDYKIPAFFTKEGWEKYVKEAIELESNRPDKADWVLGVEPHQLPAEMRDPQRMAEKLRSIYFQEYAETWWQFLQSIEYKPFDSISSASYCLKNLSDYSDSCLKSLLDIVFEQTRYESESTRGLTNKLKEKGKSIARKIKLAKKVPTQKDQESIHLLNQEFESLHALSAEDSESGGISNILQEILNQYANINLILESIMTDPGAKAKDYASRILERGSGDLPEALKTIRRTLNVLDLTSLNDLFEQPVKYTWIAILNEAQIYLNSLWQNKVYDPFQRKMAKYYPFNPRGQDALIEDVKNFFQPQGSTLWKFIEEELKPFVKLDSWQTIKWEKHGIQLSSTTIKALLRAETFKKHLFSQGELRVRFWLQPLKYSKVTDHVPIIEQITLNIDGNEYPYRMGGPRWREFSWPGLKGPPGVSLEIFSSEADFNRREYKGEWGWLRLIETAKIKQDKSSELLFILSWPFIQRGQTQVSVIINYELRASRKGDPFHDVVNFFSFRCPKRLN